MPGQKLTIWTNVRYPPAAMDLLRSGTAAHEIIFASRTEDSNLAPGVADPALDHADIAFGQPDPQQLIAHPRIRCVHLNSAGYTRYDREDLRKAFAARGAAMSNSSGI